MIKKTDKAVEYFKNGYLKEALNMFKTFRIGFNENEKRTIEIASDCLNGCSMFYQQIGFNVDNEIAKSIKIIESKYKL